MTETWKPVVGYEGFYEVSDRGSVRSVARRVDTQRGVWTYKARSVLPIKRSSRIKYLCVSLSRNNRRFTRNVAHLVAEAFIGQRPPGMHVCHNDGNAFNNRLDNLRYDTRESNEADKERHGTIRRGDNHPQAKLTSEDVAFIRERRNGGSAELAKEFRVTQYHVNSIRRGECWATVGAEGEV